MALQPANEKLTGDIRKYEEIGTHPAATHNAIAEAIAFHQGIGVERKLARLRCLRDRWADRVRTLPNVRSNTDLDPRVYTTLGEIDTFTEALTHVAEKGL